MKETLKNILYTGIGIAFLTKEKVEELKAELIEKGKMSQEEGRQFVDDLLRRSEKARDQLDLWINKRVEERIAQFDLATRDELADLRRVDAAHHQDRHRHARAPQLDALLHQRHAQLSDALRLQVARDRHQPMSVGIGLDDAHDGHTGARLQCVEIVAQCVQVDADARGPVVGFRAERSGGVESIGSVHGAIVAARVCSAAPEGGRNAR